MFAGLGLTFILGWQHIASDLEVLGLARRVNDKFVPTATAIRVAEKLERITDAHHPKDRNEPKVIVGVASAPLVYAQLLQELTTREDVIIVDPYLGAADVAVLGSLTSVRRVLTGPSPSRDRGEQNATTRREQLAIAAGTSHQLEVRTSRELHDRYMLPSSSGTGLMLGASLGGSKVTAAVEISEEATAMLLIEFNRIWSTAEPVVPIRAP
jgi:hypothetical protein